MERAAHEEPSRRLFGEKLREVSSREELSRSFLLYVRSNHCLWLHKFILLPQELRVRYS